MVNQIVREAEKQQDKKDWLEEWDDLAGECLRLAEALGVQHHLGNELTVRLGHRQTAEQLLEIVGEVGATRITRVHRDEDGHVRVDLDRLVDQLHGDVWTCKDIWVKVGQGPTQNYTSLVTQKSTIYSEWQTGNANTHNDNNKPLSLVSLLACSFRASWMVCICCEQADNMRSSKRLNSSKQPHAPTWHNPTKIRPIAYNIDTDICDV